MQKMLVWLVMSLMVFVAGIAYAATLTDNGNGTVTDSSTGLMWQQAEPGVMTWTNALSYCNGLGLGGNADWRLPNITELDSIVDFTRYSPAINTTFFPNAYASYYWSSTTYADGTDDAWHVNFNDGGGRHDYKTGGSYVRCVRGGQSGSFGNFSISGTISYNGTGISGVTVTLSGAGTGTTTTDSNGNYTFTGLSNGSYTVTPSKSGYAFTPDNITISGASQTGDNIVASSGGGGLSARAGGYSPAWLIITLISLTLVGGYLMRKRIASN